MSPAGSFTRTITYILHEVSHTTVINILVALTVLFITANALSYRRGLQAVNYLPGIRTVFHPFSIPGVLLPTAWWNPGISFLWKWRRTLYSYYGNDTISMVPLFFGAPMLYTSNIDVLRQVAASSGGRSFHKSESAGEIFTRWGMNIVVADHDVWRKHRRIMGPAFTNKLYDAVWTESLKTYREMVAEEGWSTQDQINIPAAQALTVKFALLIIGKCGFGFPFKWADPARTSDGRMSVQEALRISADSFIVTLFTPWWMKALPFKRFTEAREATHELKTFMQAQVAERKVEIRSQGIAALDVFSMLVEASENEEAKYKLDDSELIGNVYIMLFAGHETTARALAATIGLLSIHHEIQDEVYQQIISVAGNQRDPVYEDYSRLNKVLAAFLETLRIFPAAYQLVREAFEDTVLQVPNPLGEEGVTALPVPKGTTLIVDMIGLQYNPRYFDSPDEYRPSRWYDVAHDSEAFSAFSIGPRQCIGRKFATTEAVGFLTMLLRDYKLEPVLQKDETKEIWRKRVLSAKLELTLGVEDVPVTFVRRRKLD
ncbi:hypothetical protein HYPSUDRAFT_67739 [Hypholoma sublateritium FD-334 SS-4]|uniref:Cytochrome P450 n=1 Tax=Hypholoma sublateritium (strain FD-334 SS-4) TaxID=945553 RepID=A0A0D2NRI9_HYPSF|nr:hypothetical protein HYPSUDRAFT_67739 [Hypholoma sublateritium FD-334 SS-4]